MHLYEDIKTSERIFNQMPGFICMHGLDHKILFSNEKAAKIMGFKSADAAIGLQYADMRCQACEDEQNFKSQDKLIFSGRERVSFLSYHQYTDGWKLIFGEKAPLVIDKHLIGLISYWSDIVDYNLVDVSRFLIASMKKVNTDKKFTFILENSANNYYSLSGRELECLFFLLRGKTDKSIAKILQLSP